MRKLKRAGDEELREERKWERRGEKSAFFYS